MTYGLCIPPLYIAFQCLRFLYRSQWRIPNLTGILRWILVSLLFTFGISLLAASFVPFMRGIESVETTLPLPYVASYQKLYDQLSPLRSINSYGLFRQMTGVGGRPELIIQGSIDGKQWKDYVFPYKPQALGQNSVFNIPHQPRLDWQMWFAALGQPNTPWVFSLLHKLYYNSPSVLSLFSENPFERHPPDYIRVELYLYNFTVIDSHQWSRKKNKPSFLQDVWNLVGQGLPNNTWKRKYQRPWLPPLSYNDTNLASVFRQLRLPDPAAMRKLHLEVHPFHQIPILDLLLSFTTLWVSFRVFRASRTVN